MLCCWGVPSAAIDCARPPEDIDFVGEVGAPQRDAGVVVPGAVGLHDHGHGLVEVEGDEIDVLGRLGGGIAEPLTAQRPEDSVCRMPTRS